MDPSPVKSSDILFMGGSEGAWNPPHRSGTWLHAWDRRIPDWIWLEILPELSFSHRVFFFLPGTNRLCSICIGDLLTILSHPSGSAITSSMWSHLSVRHRSTWKILCLKYAKARVAHTSVTDKQRNGYLALLVERSSSVPQTMSLENLKATVGLERLLRYVVPGLALRCKGFIRTISLSRIADFSMVWREAGDCSSRIGIR